MTAENTWASPARRKGNPDALPKCFFSGLTRGQIMALISKVYTSTAVVKPRRSFKKKTTKRKRSALQTMPYAVFLKTDYWQKVREAKLAQAGGKCQICGNTKGLEVHHKHYKYRGRELHHLGCLMVLCREHHQKMHDREHQK
jgi:5-methylcytosine-specific restriction endonuclease McrA